MKYDLVGVDGNAFSVMGYVARAMKQEKFPQGEIEEYRKKAMSSDYNNLLCESMGMIEKCNKHYDETHTCENYDYNEEWDCPQYDECDGECNFV